MLFLIAVCHLLHRTTSDVARDIVRTKSALGGTIVYGSLMWLLLAGAVGKLLADQELIAAFGEGVRSTVASDPKYLQSIAHRRFNREEASSEHRP